MSLDCHWHWLYPWPCLSSPFLECWTLQILDLSFSLQQTDSCLQMDNNYNLWEVVSGACQITLQLHFKSSNSGLNLPLYSLWYVLWLWKNLNSALDPLMRLKVCRHCCPSTTGTAHSCPTWCSLVSMTVRRNQWSMHDLSRQLTLLKYWKNRCRLHPYFVRVNCLELLAFSQWFRNA